MKLASFRCAAGTECCGVVDGDRLLDLSSASSGRIVPPLITAMQQPHFRPLALELLKRAGRDAEFAALHSTAVEEAHLLAPIPRPGKILCLGLNYADHAAETRTVVPHWPVVFMKASSAVVGPGAAIRIPAVSDQVDYEVELAVVIGKPAREVPAHHAMDCVGGYTILNDVSVRDYQKVKGGGQWILGKSFDTHCPMGPWIVTADEIPDPHALAIECTVSGERLQSGCTSAMLRRIPELIEYISACMTLEPGDVIATGTPPGVGFVRQPPRWLRPGDFVECTVEGIGTLGNPVE